MNHLFKRTTLTRRTDIWKFRKRNDTRGYCSGCYQPSTYVNHRSKICLECCRKNENLVKQIDLTEPIKKPIIYFGEII